MFLETCTFFLKLINSKFPTKLQGTTEQVLAFCYTRRFEHSVSSHGYLEMCFSPTRLSGCQCQDWTSGAGWLVEPVLQVFRQMGHCWH